MNSHKLEIMCRQTYGVQKKMKGRGRKRKEEEHPSSSAKFASSLGLIGQAGCSIFTLLHSFVFGYLSSLTGCLFFFCNAQNCVGKMFANLSVLGFLVKEFVKCVMYSKVILLMLHHPRRKS